MTRTEHSKHADWFARILFIGRGDFDRAWQIINHEMECTDEDRDELRHAFHTANAETPENISAAFDNGCQ
jgi:hypothetical protein